MYTLSLDATSGATADGVATNTVTATLMNGSTYLSNMSLDFRITTGSALFPNGRQQTTVNTNVLGEAAVTFTDTVEESVTIIVILSSDSTIFQTVNSSFDNGGNDNYILTLSATSTATAGGTETNSATATILKGGVTFANQTLIFSVIVGSAYFINGSNFIKVSTDAHGQATVSFADETAETVTLLVSIEKDTSVYQTASSTFSSAGKIIISRIYNANNKDFDIITGGPHNLFLGASFYIQLSETSESLIWSCDDKNVEVRNFNGNGIVTIKGTPSSNIISIKFSNAGGGNQYDIGCDLYLNDVHLTRNGVNGDTTTTINEYRNIYNEWGDMSTFGWGKSDSTIYSAIGAFIDMSTGKDTSEDKNLSYSKPEKLV